MFYTLTLCMSSLVLASENSSDRREDTYKGTSIPVSEVKISDYCETDSEVGDDIGPL